MGSERRHSPRVLIDPPLRARAVGLDAEVSIVDVSFGGFRIHSTVAFENNADFEFLVFPSVGCDAVRIDATAMHCRVVSTEPRVVFETGFAFTDGSWSAVGIHMLIDNALSVLRPH